MSALQDINVKQFKLMSGEDVVAYVQDQESPYGYIIERPVKIHYDAGNSGFWMRNWLSMCEFSDPVFLNSSSVVAIGECTEAVKEYYIKIVTDIKGGQASPEVEDEYDDYEMDEYDTDSTVLH